MLNTINIESFTNTTPFVQKYKDLLNDEFVGKTFVYRSKYGGETIGIISHISVSLKVIFDKESEHNFNINLKYKNNRKHNGVFSEFMEITNPYKAYGYNINLHSTNGVCYDFNEVYIKQ